MGARTRRATFIAIGIVTLSSSFLSDASPALARHHHHAASPQHLSGVRMIATGYTAGCRGCSSSGRTALGYHAGYGIVSVDPRVIPLGSRLFISGYGEAIAGDTGGNIKGNRIDLGFNSYHNAANFGRREVTVYILHP